jgi:hypothetical protein
MLKTKLKKTQVMKYNEHNNKNCNPPQALRHALRLPAEVAF